MTADRFEARVADWLEDGPEAAPDRLTDAVLDHAARHPHTRIAAWRRRAMRHGRLLAVAALALAVVGVGAGAWARFRLTDTAIGPVAVTGSESCTTRVAGARLYVTDTNDEVRGRIDVCQDALSDPRVSGEQTRQVSAWFFTADAEAPRGSSNWFGTLEIANDRGRWSGAFVGTFDGQTTTTPGRLSWAALGSGGYDGLVYRAALVVDQGGARTLTGTIEPIADDAIVASTWCWVTTAVPSVDGERVAHRVAYRDCTVTSTDDRLNGMASEERAIDVRDDGATADTGTLNVTTAAGTWAGSFSGTGDWYVHGRVTGTLAGSGSLAGLTMPFEIVSEDGMHGVLLGTIQAAN
jgi:hypothetical protein